LWIPNYKYVRCAISGSNIGVDQSKNEILPNIEMQNKPIKSKSDVEYWKQTLCQT